MSKHEIVVNPSGNWGAPYAVHAGGVEVGIGLRGECHALAEELRRDAAMAERLVNSNQGESE